MVKPRPVFAPRGSSVATTTRSVFRTTSRIQLSYQSSNMTRTGITPPGALSTVVTAKNQGVSSVLSRTLRRGTEETTQVSREASIPRTYLEILSRQLGCRIGGTRTMLAGSRLPAATSSCWTVVPPSWLGLITKPLRSCPWCSRNVHKSHRSLTPLLKIREKNSKIVHRRFR